MRHAEPSSSASSDKVPPSPSTVDQTSHIPEPRVGVTDIQLVKTKLSGEAVGQIGLQITVIPTSVHQVGRPTT